MLLLWRYLWLWDVRRDVLGIRHDVAAALRQPDGVGGGRGDVVARREMSAPDPANASVLEPHRRAVLEDGTLGGEANDALVEVIDCGHVKLP